MSGGVTTSQFPEKFAILGPHVSGKRVIVPQYGSIERAGYFWYFIPSDEFPDMRPGTLRLIADLTSYIDDRYDEIEGLA